MSSLISRGGGRPSSAAHSRPSGAERPRAPSRQASDPVSWQGAAPGRLRAADDARVDDACVLCGRRHSVATEGRGGEGRGVVDRQVAGVVFEREDSGVVSW